jgi:hypothetical protein
MKRVAILQSNYIPWKGYFDLINLVDEFILYDDVQYTRRDWRNRNKIKTSKDAIWLTIPVNVKGKYDQKIKDTVVDDSSWIDQHWKSIQINYSKTKYFKEISPIIHELYEKARTLTHLSEINYLFLTKICELLEINTKITWSMDSEIIDGRTERLLDLCIQSNATEYLSGPAAKNYLDESLFAANGISVKWMDYSNYPEYPQLYSPPFIHSVSIIDLIFNVGPFHAKKYMLSFNKEFN